MPESDTAAEERQRFRELCDAPPPRKLSYPCFQKPEEEEATVEEEKEQEEKTAEEEAGAADGPARGIVIQGGVGKKVRAELAAHLEACGYSKDSPKHSVYLFCNWNKEWDGSVFGAPKTITTGDLFLTTNIVPILLHDPGKGELAWGEDELQTFYDAVDLAKADLDDGKTVIVACVAGKNRSVAMERALTLNPHREPSCDAMERAAQGYLRDKDMSIVPLFPQPPKRKRENES